MKLRKFTKKGLKIFENHYISVIDETTRPGDFDVSRYYTDEFSRVIDNGIDLPEGPFETRYELGNQLVPALDSFMSNDRDVEMWSWLGCYYFNTIFTTPNGDLKLGELANIVLNPSSWRKFRHKVFGPAYFVYAYGSSSECILNTHPQTAGEIYENFSGRVTLISIPVLDIMKKVCWDEQRNDWKRGTKGRGPKSFNELLKLLRQLAHNNMVIDCETSESQNALIEKFPENQRP